MKKLFFLFFILTTTIICNAQEKPLPESLKPFLLQGYEMLDYAEGDLNNDKKPDAILIQKLIGEDTIVSDDLKRPFILLLRQADGKLTLAKRNDDLVMCRQCGGAFGDPYEKLEIKNNGFTVSFYGGSSWRWGYDYTFSYQPQKNDWFLTQEKQLYYHNTEPEINMKKTTIESDELDEVSVEKFNTEFNETETTWKVTSAKAYFYDNPKKGSKPRKAYLIKGDKVKTYRILKNFIAVEFENKKSNSTSGYILKSDLEKIK